MGCSNKEGNQQVDSIHGRFDGKQDPSLLRSNQMLSIVRNRARLHAEFVVVETAFERFVTSDDLHTTASGDRIFHFHAPIGRVDHKPTQARAFQIDSATHRAMEDPGYFALAGLPRLNPRNWEWLELFIWLIIGLASHQGLAPYKRSAFGRETGVLFVGAIDIRVAPDIRDSSEDRMHGMLFVEKATR